MRNGILAMIGGGVLVGLAVGASNATLRACALDLSILRGVSACERPTAPAARVQLAALAQDRVLLERRIVELETELARRQCAKAPPDPDAPLTRPGWDRGDLSMFYGCWKLDSVYRTRDVDSGEIRTYDEWRMCFATDGTGSQTMRATDGTLCKGAINAEFDGGRLTLSEPGNLSCSDGGFIHNRQISCGLSGGGASCDTQQAQTGGAGGAAFERARILDP